MEFLEFTHSFWWNNQAAFDEKTVVFISKKLTDFTLKKFKHTNEELELAKLQSEKEKKKKESEE